MSLVYQKLSDWLESKFGCSSLDLDLNLDVEYLLNYAAVCISSVVIIRRYKLTNLCRLVRGVETNYKLIN